MSTGFPILGILGLIFVTLKLAGIGVVAAWSWWLVLLPFYIAIVVLGVVFVVGASIIWIAKYFK